MIYVPDDDDGDVYHDGDDDDDGDVDHDGGGGFDDNDAFLSR
jgi:hypothetical protein